MAKSKTIELRNTNSDQLDDYRSGKFIYDAKSDTYPSTLGGLGALVSVFTTTLITGPIAFHAYGMGIETILSSVVLVSGMSFWAGRAIGHNIRVNDELPHITNQSVNVTRNYLPLPKREYIFNIKDEDKPLVEREHRIIVNKKGILYEEVNKETPLALWDKNFHEVILPYLDEPSPSQEVVKKEEAPIAVVEKNLTEVQLQHQIEDSEMIILELSEEIEHLYKENNAYKYILDESKQKEAYYQAELAKREAEMKKYQIEQKALSPYSKFSSRPEPECPCCVKFERSPSSHKTYHYGDIEDDTDLDEATF